MSQIVRSSSSLCSRPKRFIATYDPARFKGIQRCEWPARGEPFRLLFVGRIEENKGVLDLVEIMKQLQDQEPGRFTLDICGEGAAASKLNEEIREEGVYGIVTVHGQCGTHTLAKLYADSHVVIIPTRSDFEEGAPKIAFEAVLNLRPIVMSAACPAIEDVGGATVEARVDDVADYVTSIRKLANDSTLYSSKVSAAEAYRWKHFDESYSYGMILRPAFAKLVTARQTCKNLTFLPFMRRR